MSNTASDTPLAEHADALPAGTRLGEFEILRVLGVGGFGIVYLAMDHGLQREVALKEYLPSALAGRGRDGMVSVRSKSNLETYQLGMRSFINEARLLARFDHPSLVKVYRFWEDKGTAYMVMPFYRGSTLKQLRAGMSAPPGEAWLRSLLDDVLGALDLLHAEGVYHRDVAPDNILVGDDGRAVLLDFGAARRVIGDRTQSFTAILKPTFAPIEQYADVTTLRQGPWTDLYALAATVYHLLSAQSPLPAAARMLQDDMPRLTELPLPEFSPQLLQALDWALAVRPQDRPQTVTMLREALQGEIPVPVHVRRDITRPNVATLDVAPGRAWATTSVRETAGPAAVAAARAAPRAPAVQPPVQPPAVSAPASTSRRGLWLAAGGLLLAAAALALWPRGQPAAPAAPALKAAAPPASAVWITELATPASGAAAPLPAPSAAASRPARAASRAAVAAMNANEGAAMGAAASPREACGSHKFIALLFCIQQQCSTPRFHEHAQCVRLREEEAARRERMNAQ
jgi:hypothetical protein